MSAAIAGPQPTMGSGNMMGSGATTGSGTMMGSGATMGSARMMGPGTMIIHHKVTDYAKWRVAFDADQVNRTAAGLSNCKVQRSMDDANDVMISCAMADVAKARSFADSKTLADTMSKAGVMGKPQILFLTAPK